MTEENSIQPIFVFSLPRSGSTLTQRILSSHPEISSKSETWLLLPLFYSMRRQGAMAVYGHDKQVSAIVDLCESLPGHEDDYLKAIEVLASTIYRRASEGDSKYFVDKTPRYHLIVEEIINTFPDAKFIFLWRNPLSIIASIITTWGGGKWNLFQFYIDLYKGLENLVVSCRKHKDKVLAVCYEDIVDDPENTCRKIFSYLGLEYMPELMENFTRVEFSGVMGDQVGSRQYTKISELSSGKWKSVLNNPVRKFWCRRYLCAIGKGRLEFMGYKQASLARDLKQAPLRFRYIFSDLARMSYGIIHRTLDVPVFRKKLEEYRCEGRMYPHN